MYVVTDKKGILNKEDRNNRVVTYVVGSKLPDVFPKATLDNFLKNKRIELSKPAKPLKVPKNKKLVVESAKTGE